MTWLPDPPSTPGIHWVRLADTKRGGRLVKVELRNDHTLIVKFFGTGQDATVDSRPDLEWHYPAETEPS